MRNLLAGLLGYAILATLLLSCTVADAQTVSIQQPTGVVSDNHSGTIISGGIFQQVFPSGVPVNGGNGRMGCTIQNNGTHNMYVFAGPIANATDGHAVTITPGNPYYCQVTNGLAVIRDQISIDGTTSDAFYAAQQ